jgi:predicted ArsR family transcriptional regulator
VAEAHRAINRVVVLLDERRRRLFVGLLAQQVGHGGVAALAQITGLSRTTIRRGQLELAQPERVPAGRVRQPGGGRPRLEKKTPAC